MKSSFGKLGRKLTMQKTDVKEVRDHQASAHLDDLAQASKDMQYMRNCYDGLLYAAAATTNSIYGHGNDGNGSVRSQGTIVLVQGAGGIFAGAAASLVTTPPLDIIKTRLQVMGHEKQSSTRQVIKTLIAEDGWKGFYKGIGPRFLACQHGEHL